MKKLLMILTAFVFVATLASCSGEKGYTNITNEELKTMLENPDDYQFVDVRTISEYYDSHIPGFNRIIDYYILEDDYSGLDVLDKDKPVVLICRTGNRSVLTAEIMVKEGFTEIYTLTDGITGWDGETE